jgi:arsenate reductase (thioredoxin)
MSAPKFDLISAAAQPFSRRRFMATTAGLIVATGCSTLPKSQRKSVLFVCEFGTAKSVIAREMFRRRATTRSIAIAAFSRGLVIEDHITPDLRRNLAADGIDPYSEPFKILQPDDWSRASVVVAFNPLPKIVPQSKVRDWTDVPSVVSQYPAARAALNRRIDALLDEFAAR